MRIDSGNGVIGHDAEAAVQVLELGRRIRLDHIEHAEQQEADSSIVVTPIHLMNANSASAASDPAVPGAIGK